MDTIAGAPSTTLTVERLDPVGWSDGDAEPLAAVYNAASAVDSPHEAPVRPSQLRLRLQHGEGGPPVDHLLIARRGDRTVGYLQAWFGHWDNPDVASLDPLVHPDVRGDDVVADALVNEVLELCRADGRTSMISDAWHGSWLAAYWERRGWPVATRTAQRRIVVADIDPAVLDRLQAEAERASEAYDIEVLPFPTPDALVEPMLDVHRAMNDAPLDDLRLEDDTWSRERLRASEASIAARGVRLHTLIARRRADGAIGGFTEVAVDPVQPEIGDQGDTGVIGTHRGHRLGLRLKVAMLRRLAETEPGLITIDTWNAESNDHMIAVNAQLGCFVVARGVLVQHDLG